MHKENHIINTVLVKPKEEFTHNFQAEASLRIGPAYIEERDTHPKKLSEVDILLQIKIKLLDISQGNFVKDNIHSLWGLFFHQNSLVYNSIKYEVSIENEYILVEFPCNKEELMIEIKNNGMFDDYVEYISLWTEVLNLPNGKSDVKLRLGVGPAFFYNSNTTYEQLFPEVFNIALSCNGDDQIKSLIRPFEESLRREAKGKNDEIQAKLVDPLCDYVKQNILNSSNVKVDYTYDKEYVLGLISEYNSAWNTYRNSYESTKDTKKEVFNTETLNFLLESFVGPFFKALPYIDLDNIEFGFWNNVDTTSLKVKINVVGANEFVEKEILCHIKSDVN